MSENTLRVFEFDGSLPVSATIAAVDEATARRIFSSMLATIEYSAGEAGIEFSVSDEPDGLDVTEVDDDDAS